MTFRVRELRRILGPRLAHLWLNDEAQDRLVTCVTCLERAGDIANAQPGELMLLVHEAAPERCAVEILERGTAAAALLLLPRSLSGAAERKVRALAMNGPTAVGVLAPGIESRDAANLLSRALASASPGVDGARLYAAQTLQSLAEMLGRLIGNSVTIESPSHEVLASSPTGNDVDQDRVHTILRRRAAAKIMEHPDFKQFFSRVRVSDWPLHLDAHPELGHSGRVAMRVAAHGDLYGIIWATDTARPLDDRDYAVIRQAAEVAAAIFARGQLAARRDAMLRVQLIEDVIQGRILDAAAVRAAAFSLGWNVDRLQQALVVSLNNVERFRAGRTGVAWQREQERLVDLVKLEALAVDPEAVVGLRDESVVLLLDTGREPGAERKAAAVRLAGAIVRRTSAFLPETRVTVGIGRDVASFEEIAQSFQQAQLAAESGQALWSGNRAIHYDDLGIHRVLFMLRGQEEIVPPALQRIIAHDIEHGTDYVRTLGTYLRHMGRLRSAAAELGVHRNTLEYRIGRIAQLAETDLDNADDRLALELGIRLLELDASSRRELSARPASEFA